MIARPSIVVKVDVKCVHCGKWHTLTVEQNDYTDWAEGRELIQNAMPYLTAGERELLISGTCDPCWDKLFNFGEEDEG